MTKACLCNSEKWNNIFEVHWFFIFVLLSDFSKGGYYLKVQSIFFHVPDITAVREREYFIDLIAESTIWFTVSNEALGTIWHVAVDARLIQWAAAVWHSNFVKSFCHKEHGASGHEWEGSKCSVICATTVRYTCWTDDVRTDVVSTHWNVELFYYLLRENISTGLN